MKIGHLELFKRMNSNGTPIKSFAVAAWHNSRSITWRWVITYSPRKHGRTGVYFNRTYKGRGLNFFAGINCPYIGSITVHTQPSMWIKK